LDERVDDCQPSACLVVSVNISVDATAKQRKQRWGSEVIAAKAGIQKKRVKHWMPDRVRHDKKLVIPAKAGIQKKE
jgi:hypothetical protein